MAEADDTILAGEHTYESIGARIGGTVLDWGLRPWWLLCMFVALLLLGVLAGGLIHLFSTGIGIWGNNIPVAWGVAIASFVWWIGIGHAGTFISAFLVLMRQPWRNSINRLAEAMTLFAVICAGLYPLLHLGRPWFFYWLLPYPNTMDMYPQVRSPLVWDAFAVFTYFTISLLFWYLGLIPDLATVRDRAEPGLRRKIYGFFALGWRGAGTHWKHYKAAYIIFAGIATPLVISVHSIVGMDFAIGIQPGWHSTFFSPYFVAGALFSGFAMVAVLAIPLRFLLSMEDFITGRHLDNNAKLMLLTGLIVTWSYVNEHFMIWYTGNPFEIGMMNDRFTGPMSPIWWATVFFNCVIIQPLWFKRVRTSPKAQFFIAVGVLIGMFTERYIIVMQSLHHGFLPSSYDMYTPTFWDWAILAGTVGLFSTLFLLFVRYVPISSISEIRELAHKQHKVREGWHDETQFWPTPEPDAKLWGVAARFDSTQAYERAVERLGKSRYTRWETYTPFEVEEFDDNRRQTAIPLIGLVGGLLGGGFAFSLMSYANVVGWPINVGGRPYWSWPSFIPITFEMTVLGCGLSIFFGVLWLNRLPRLHHPLFSAPGFDDASSNGFWVCIERDDKHFDPRDVKTLLHGCGPDLLVEVPDE